MQYTLISAAHFTPEVRTRINEGYSYIKQKNQHEILEIWYEFLFHNNQPVETEYQRIVNFLFFCMFNFWFSLFIIRLRWFNWLGTLRLVFMKDEKKCHRFVCHLTPLFSLLFLFSWRHSLFTMQLVEQENSVFIIIYEFVAMPHCLRLSDCEPEKIHQVWPSQWAELSKEINITRCRHASSATMAYRWDSMHFCVVLLFVYPLLSLVEAIVLSFFWSKWMCVTWNWVYFLCSLLSSTAAKLTIFFRHRWSSLCLSHWLGLRKNILLCIDFLSRLTFYMHLPHSTVFSTNLKIIICKLGAFVCHFILHTCCHLWSHRNSMIGVQLKPTHTKYIQYQLWQTMMYCQCHAEGSSSVRGEKNAGIVLVLMQRACVKRVTCSWVH